MNQKGSFHAVSRGRISSEMNVVPFIDVVLVLLVIFMVATPLMTQGVHVDLPRLGAQAIDTPDHPPLVISIDAEGLYYLNRGEDQRVQLALPTVGQQVRDTLGDQANTAVLIRGDRAVSYGRIMELMGTLQQAGVPNIGLISQPADAAP
ncbi:protein TolR [Pseudomonas alliivorans]|uniref:protein TolR n=1 Tax=Pseudomonas TaxID=286 RepID=UPI001AE4203B|nr:protein TolR [Pseudomonas alliivorans]MBP0951563.1 protein TolR [Pseudomonas alliivorans]MEE4691187.1 protein TolR [Pseudomonas alliivorans]MEE4711750.1 protein TolR [Pseudomonas alliivorans]MEE4726915.1 protein TolR [Pseudomonas alliivorans]MEE4732667.1 protein TolR [Pseudomonas alliivorans]